MLKEIAARNARSDRAWRKSCAEDRAEFVRQMKKIDDAWSAIINVNRAQVIADWLSGQAEKHSAEIKFRPS